MKGWITRRSSILLAVTAAGCGSPRTLAIEPAPPEPVPQAVAPEPVVLGEAEIRAVAEIMLMEDRRELDPRRMAELASHWSPEVRKRAALAWGRVRDGAHVDPLLGLLSDPDPGVRVDATFALGQLADGSDRVTAALATIARQHPTDSLGTEAVAALAKSGTPAAFDTLVSLLRPDSSEKATPVISQALVSLWRFGPRAAAAVEAIGRWTADPDPVVRWRAIYPMVRTAVAGAGSLYLALAEDPDPAVRAIAVRALRSATADSAGIRPVARQTLLAALDDRDPHVRINALGALATWDGNDIAGAVLPLLDDPDGNVRMAAVATLSAMGGAQAIAALERVAADPDARTGIRVAALTGLAGLDPERSVPTARAWATSTRWYERFSAARSLATVPWADARPVLEELTGDEDRRVAAAAITATGRAAGPAGAGLPIFLGALQAADPRVRAAAISAIARQGGAAELSVLMDAYDTAQRDSTPEAALAAVNGLALLGRNGSPVGNAFFARFGAHPDATVRRAVANRLGDGWGESPAESELQGIAFYEDVVRTLVAPVLAGTPAPLLRIVTPEGPIDIELAPVEAPLTVHNIISLVESGYYDSNGDEDARRWHRVVPNFVLQDGEPVGDGSGGPGYAIRDEINRLRYGRGMLGMALSGPDTGGGQFFITHSPQPHLDGGYTIFGRVTDGMTTADAVIQDDRIITMEIVWR